MLVAHVRGLGQQVNTKTATRRMDTPSIVQNAKQSRLGPVHGGDCTLLNMATRVLEVLSAINVETPGEFIRVVAFVLSYLLVYNDSHYRPPIGKWAHG